MRDDVEREGAPVVWWQRALPVTVMAGVAAVAVLQLGGSNEQVRLSTAREDQQFVELSLTTSPQRVCSGQPGSTVVDVVSHLDRRRVGWVVAVDPAGPAKPQVRERGQVRVEPGESRAVRTQARGSGAYDVVVRVAGRPERLLVHCGGGR